MPPRHEVWEAFGNFLAGLLLRNLDLLTDPQLGGVEAGIFRFKCIDLRGKFLGDLGNRITGSHRVIAVGVNRTRHNAGSAAFGTLWSRRSSNFLLGFFNCADS